MHWLNASSSELNNATVLGQLLIFLTFVIKMWYDWKVEARRQKWAEDKEHRDELDKKEAEVDRDKKHNEAMSKLRESILMNEQAISAANDINKKIVALGAKRNELFDEVLRVELDRHKEENVENKDIDAVGEEENHGEVRVLREYDDPDKDSRGGETNNTGRSSRRRV